MTSSTVRRSVTVERRPVGANDVPLLRGLFADAHVELSVLPPDTRFVLVDMQFRAQRRQHAEQYPLAQHDVLLVNGAEVGRILVDKSATEWRVVDLTIALGHRHEGIGRAVLAELVDSAAADGCRVTGTFWSGNDAVRSLCGRVGLHTVGETDGYLAVSSDAFTPAG